MALSRDDIFTVTWSIENFSMCPQDAGARIESVPFVVDSLDKIKFRLLLYPRGNNSVDTMACYLCRIQDPEKDLKVSMCFGAISANPKKTIKTPLACCNFRNQSSWGFEEMCSREAIFNSENEMLKNDTFTINCHIWEKYIEQKDAEAEIDSRNANFLASKKSSTTNEHHVFTRINLELKPVLWSIKGFSDVRPNTKLIKTVSSAKNGGPTFDLTFYLTESQDNDCAQLDISRNGANRDSQGVFVRCKIKTVGASEEIRYQREDEHYFKGRGRDTKWTFPMFLKRKKMIEEKYLYYTDDVLHLHFEFSFSDERKGYCNFEDKNSDSLVNHPRTMPVNSPTHYYKTLRKNGVFSDVIIQTGDRDFNVHSCILGTRSPVFRAMLETDMQEKENGLIKIADLDTDTVGRMIDFMYTDMLEGVRHQDVTSLYCAANKYDIEPLKCRCRCIFMSNFSERTVGEVLCLAEMYCDEELLEAIRSFIHENTKEVFQSKAWKEFKQKNFRLAADVMIRILSEKFLH